MTDTNSPCTAASLLPDGKQLICAYGNGTVSLWNLKDSTQSSVNLNAPCTALDLHSNLPLVAVGTDQGFTTLINATNMHIVSKLGKVEEVIVFTLYRMLLLIIQVLICLFLR